MSDSRKRLSERFVALSLQRIDGARAAALGYDRADDELLREVMGELHTLKGEAMMLGFASAGAIAHQLEEFWQVVRESGAFARGEASQVLAAALDILILALERERDAELEQSANELLGRAESPGPHARASAVGLADAEPLDDSLLPPELSRRRVDLRAAAQRWTHVNTEQIDQVCDATDALAVGFAQARAALDRLRAAETLQERRGALRLLVEEFERRAVELQALTGNAWALRLMPVEPVLDELAEHALALADEQQKQIDVSTRAEGAEVERGVLDELREPLLHLVRNAIDHGIEAPDRRGTKSRRGRLRVSAESSGPNVLFSVEDDGCGMDPELLVARAVEKRLLTPEQAAALPHKDKCDLVFVPGFSTRDAVTTVSGRGIGLDVVRRKVEALSGSVTMTTEVGIGTSFTLTVPAKLSREPVLVVDIEELLIGIASRHVRSVAGLATVQLEDVIGGRVLRQGGESLPVHSLSAALSLRQKQPESVVAVIDLGRRAAALTMPSVLGEYELLRRPVDSAVACFGWIGASAILEDGRLVLLPHVSELLRRGVSSRSAEHSSQPAQRRRRVLVVDDSLVVRDLLTEILLGAGYEVIAAADGAEGWAVVERAQPDLVVSDVEMPELDGFGLLGRIRERSLKLPVIMLTTRGSLEDRRRAASLGADAYLIKSDFQGPALLDQVNRYLGT